MKARLVPVYFDPGRDADFDRQRDALGRLLGDVADLVPPVALGRPLPEAEAVVFPQLLGEAYRRLEAFKAIRRPILIVTSEFEAAEKRGILHYVNHNYRRCPAVVLARQLMDQGQVGRIFHWRGAYLQSWIVDPNFPLTWQLRKETAGAGPHWDLNSHSVDLARYLVGEIRSVMAMTARFVPRRPLPDEVTARAFEGVAKGGRKGKVTVEDAAFMLVEFEGGARGAFEATRFAPGRKNFNCFEIYGDRGSLAFNLERMNELQFYSASDPACAQGFRTILATELCHPYIPAWWPPGHTIGYEHEFMHAVADFVTALAKGAPMAPDFYDGMRTIQVLEAGLESARTGTRVELKAPRRARKQAPCAPAPAVGP